ncbi:sensor histidine kinase KdpD [Siccirubricoccus sp. G192]|uniref:sensor histidine kinase n=1 Tax=Siccirubricoccus sp. G192 TaxID=2849651 RepID=UPI001C2BC493|nr:HAMP domain-containing sensor histidine kinase [Siccirubricoccus sp. G192]MBV1800309.1 HAMP domain-containing histidine kinase [Siccirubricoccus sp. G192]
MAENARLRAALARAKLDADAASEVADLRRRVEELVRAVRARDDFIAIAAHELRNPMTPILGLAKAALTAARNAEGASPRVTTLLEHLQRAAQDFIRRATRLLDVGRIESGNLRLEPSETDLSELVRMVAQRYAAAAAHGRSALGLEAEDGVSGMWDRLAAEEIVENLLSNALKFGMGRPVTLRLRSDGRSAVLEVQDRGVGMPPEQQTRIFGRFEQVVGQHRGSGFGIGLWVASRLVAAMDGRIAVSSRPGEGSTFTVTLPLAPLEPDRTTHATG